MRITFSQLHTVAGTVKVKGGGVYEYVDVDDASNVYQNYIDPNTGEPFETNAKMTPDGFYQRIDSVETNIAMIAGQTVYGRF